MTNSVSGISWTNVYTGNQNDDVRISKADGIAGLMGLYEVNINGNIQLMSKEQLEHTRFNLEGGHDTLVVAPDVDAAISADGGAGNDVMMGGAGGDDFNGGAGRDILIGRGGNDLLDGGMDRERDKLDGGAGRDWINVRREDSVFGDGARSQDFLNNGDVQDAARKM